MTDKNEATHLPQPGEVVHIDFRTSGQQAPAAQPSNSSRPLRLVQWNIERGYQLPLVIKQLQDLDADVTSLQEASHSRPAVLEQ